MENQFSKMTFAAEGAAPILSYSVPEPLTYNFNAFFPITFEQGVPLDKIFLYERKILNFNAKPVGGIDFSTVIKSEIENAIMYGKMPDIANKVINMIHEKYPLDADGTDNKINELKNTLVFNIITIPSGFTGLSNLLKDGKLSTDSFDYYRYKKLVDFIRATETNDKGESDDSWLKTNKIPKTTQLILDKLCSSGDTTKNSDFEYCRISEDFSGIYDIKFIRFEPKIGKITSNNPPGTVYYKVGKPRITIVEKYKLSNYLGNYAAGRVIKTFSLLPGEKTKISIKTFRKSTIDSKSSSSILDSFSAESADSFESALSKEQSNKDNSTKSSSWYVDAEVEGGMSFGIGHASAKVKGGYKSDSASGRENAAKNVSNALKKHSETASKKRDIQINTSYEVKVESSEETSIERELENINLSRTLNFVFRQMNQEYISILHLVDVKIAYSDGTPGSYQEYAISELNDLLDVYVKDRPISDVASGTGNPDQPLKDFIKERILDQLSSIVNYKDQLVPFVREAKHTYKNPITGKDKSIAYYQTLKEQSSTYEEAPNPENPQPNGLKINVPGIILSVSKNTIRTEGVVVDAFLGQGEALDAYSQGLQIEAVNEKRIINERNALINDILKDGNTAKADIYAKLFPCCPSVQCGCKEKSI